MPWLMARVYNRVMAPAEQACLHDWRRELFADLHGRVRKAIPLVRPCIRGFARKPGGDGSPR